MGKSLDVRLPRPVGLARTSAAETTCISTGMRGRQTSSERNNPEFVAFTRPTRTYLRSVMRRAGTLAARRTGRVAEVGAARVLSQGPERDAADMHQGRMVAAFEIDVVGIP